MRKIIFILLLFWANFVHATNYYVDATLGDDTNTGTSANFAWKTLSKVNSFAYIANDGIYFKSK